MGSVLLNQGRLVEAEPFFREALQIHREVLPAGHPENALSLDWLGGLFKAQGKVAEAESQFRQALDIRRAALPPEHPLVAHSLRNLGSLLLEQAKFDLAMPLLCEALEVFRRTLPAGHSDMASVVNNLAKGYESLGDLVRAQELFKSGVAEFPADAVLAGNFAFFLQNSLGDLADARAEYERALQVDPNDFVCRTNYATLCLVMGNRASAAVHVVTALELAATGQDGYIYRPLFVKAILAATGGEDATSFLGRIKGLLAAGVAVRPSKNTSLSQYLNTALTGEALHLFDTLFEVLAGLSPAARLDDLPAWHALPTLSS